MTAALVAFVIFAVIAGLGALCYAAAEVIDSLSRPQRPAQE
jgi:hypothetical protein